MNAKYNIITSLNATTKLSNSDFNGIYLIYGYMLYFIDDNNQQHSMGDYNIMLHECLT